MPPPRKVLADPEVKLIVPVPVTVRLVTTAVSQAKPDPAIDHVPDPTTIVRTFVLDELTTAVEPDKVTLNVEESKVPDVITNAVVESLVEVNASCNVTAPLGLSKLRFCENEMPALVIV